LFKSTRLGTIFRKRYACGGLYAEDFKISFVKVDLVTIRYIAQIIDGLQPRSELVHLELGGGCVGRVVPHGGGEGHGALLNKPDVVCNTIRKSM